MTLLAYIRVLDRPLSQLDGGSEKRSARMSGLKSGLVTFAFVGLCGLGTVVGCSADGSGASFGDTTETDAAGGPPATLPPSGSSGGTEEEDSGTTAPKKDAGKDSSPPDAGPPPPVPGTPCTTLDEVKKKSCGACGTASTICLDDNGSKKWTIYSTCLNELTGGCIPGTTVDEACGNCGTKKKTCTQYCAFTTAACTGQPTSSCVPGSVDLSTASCDTTTFLKRTCGSACTYGNFSATCSAPPTVIEVGPTPGSVSSTVAILASTQVLPRIQGTACPAATMSTTVTSPYVYLQVHNPLATAATVAIYNSLAPGGVAYKTALAAYDGAVSPTDEPTRKTCLKAKTYGTTALTGDSKFASLDGTTALSIAAGATVSVYVAAYYAYDATKPADSTGKVKLNVQTVSVP